MNFGSWDNLLKRKLEDYHYLLSDHGLHGYNIRRTYVIRDEAERGEEFFELRVNAKLRYSSNEKKRSMMMTRRRKSTWMNDDDV